MIAIGVALIGISIFTGSQTPELAIPAGVIGVIVILIGHASRSSTTKPDSRPTPSPISPTNMTQNEKRGGTTAQHKRAATTRNSPEFTGQPYSPPPKLEDIVSPDGYVAYQESLMHGHSTRVVANDIDAIVKMAKNAIETGGALAFRYEKDSGEVTDRRVEPTDIYRGYHDRLYLKGYDFMRDDDRTFRLDRMSDVRVDE